MDVEIVSAEHAPNNVKRALEEAGLSQEEVARRVYVSYRHFNRVTLGQTEPTFLLVKKLEVALGKPGDFLFPVKIVKRKTRKAVA